MYSLKEHKANNRDDASSDISCHMDHEQISNRTTRIRHLNDQLRIHGQGGMIVCTKGILNLETDVIAAIGDVVRSFDGFSEDNDPHGEHDCAMVSIDGYEIIFKIDYFDVTLSHHSPDASDPTVTKRIMTIMLAEEY